MEFEIDKLLKENYVNAYHVATPKILCKMLEIAGSSKRLSRFPASTIQLLGSEKNFFKALKFNKNTPKYGVIFNHPLVISLPFKNKAKFSRTLAAKIAIAIKADITNNKIYEELDKTIKIKHSKLK
jgi:RNA processing factor Prp31